MISGVVTNCFRTQLDDSATLRELIGEAVRRGFRAIELRQGSLGEFEDDHQLPLPDALSELPAAHADVQFNVAMQLPFLSVGDLETTLAVGRNAAVALAAGSRPRPHLRLVDLFTNDARLSESDVGIIAGQVAWIAASLHEVGGLLSIENGPQRWEPFYLVFQSARRQLGSRRDCLQLCYDPCNLLMGRDNPDPNRVTADLIAAEIALFHFKQRDAGTVLTNVRDGEIDWRTQAVLLQQMKYAGPGLLEIGPSREIWGELAASHAYLRAAGIAWC